MPLDVLQQLNQPTVKVFDPRNFIGPRLPVVVKPAAPTPKIKNTIKAQPRQTITVTSQQKKEADAIAKRQSEEAANRVIEYQKKSGAKRFADEIPGAIIKVRRGISNFGKGILQGTARSGAATAITLAKGEEKVREKVFGPKSVTYRVPESITQKTLYGEKPVSGFTGEGEDILQSLGANELAKNKPVAFAVGGALSLLDFTGGGKKQTLGLLAKANKVDDVVKILKRSGIADDVITDIAPKIAKTTDVNLIQKLMTETKPRGFVESVKAAPNMASEIKSGVQGAYKTVSNQATIEEAKQLIKTSTDDALRLARSGRADAISNTVRQQLIVEFQKAGRIEDAIDMAEITAKRATNQGQAVQALAAFGKLTPEGILRFTQKQIDLANEVRKSTTKLKLDPEVAKNLINQATEIQKMADGRAKDVAIAKLLDTVAAQIPSTVLQKVSSLQTMAQLLNPKTAIRNVVGNVGFMGAETAKDVVAAAVDKAVGIVTGKRTKAMPSILTQLSGLKKGFKLGMEDAVKGINTSSITSQFDLPKRLVFKNRFLRGAEKLMNIELRAPDRAFYTAAFEDSLRQQMKLAKATKATDEMVQVAHLDGLYRTFQDDSALAKMFTGIKRALNVKKDFGLGDVVIKYPKTPGNLLSRGLAYSPAGFVNAIYELAKPVMGTAFDQKAFVEAFSRAAVGTGSLVGTGAILHKLGIITGKRPDDKDIAQLERETGLGQYKINLSALKRFALSFDPSQAKPRQGDKLVSYDWFQPAAIGVSIGANIDENLSKPGLKDKVSGIIPTLLASLGEGVDTLGEQPLVQGITRPFRYSESIGDAALQTLKGIPASFVPTILNQIRQLTDNTSRETKDPSVAKEAIKQAQVRIPGLASKLPARRTVFGETQEVYQGGSNTLFNVLANPAFISKINKTPEAQMVLDIYKNSGETQQAPRVVPFSQTVIKNGESENIKLTGKQQTEMQEFIGKITKDIFSKMAANKEFTDAGDEDKAKYLAGLLSDINTVAKIKLLGHRPLKPPKRVIKLYELYGK